MSLAPLLLLFMIHKFAGQNGAPAKQPGRHHPPPKKARKRPNHPTHHTEPAHNDASPDSEHEPEADMKIGPVETIKHGKSDHGKGQATYAAPPVAPKKRRKRGHYGTPPANFDPSKLVDSTEHSETLQDLHEAPHAVVPAKRTVESHQQQAAPTAPDPVAAANWIYKNATSNPRWNWGTKNNINPDLLRAQRDMGLSEADADGVYGPATRIKGRAITGKSFPVRGARVMS